MCLDQEGKVLVGGYKADEKICIDLKILIIILSYRKDPKID